MLADIERYIKNYYSYYRTDISRDKIFGFFYLLPISDRLWQYVTIDFKSIPPSKEGYDMVFVVINYFNKQAVFFSCYKTVIAEDMVRFYINIIFRYKDPSESIISDRGP
jgi:hypothetical protein